MGRQPERPPPQNQTTPYPDCLEHQFESELNVERFAIADTRRTRAVLRARDLTEGPASDIRDRWIRKVPLIEDVEDLHTELAVHPFGNRGVLEDREVHISKFRPA